MCALLTLIFLGPRVFIIFWWLVNPGRWDAAFSTFIIPILGFIFLPWTTLMFVAVAPRGSVSGDDVLWLALAFMLDLVSGGFGFRGRRYAYP